MSRLNEIRERLNKKQYGIDQSAIDAYRDVDYLLKENDRLTRAWEAMHKSKTAASSEARDWFIRGQELLNEIEMLKDQIKKFKIT